MTHDADRPMTLGALSALLEEHAYLKYRKTLTCAPDVWEAVKAGSVPAEPRMPWEPDLSSLTGIEVVCVQHYPAGAWKLTRHDSCTVIGGETPEQSMIVTHENCTVLAEHNPAGQP